MGSYREGQRSRPQGRPADRGRTGTSGAGRQPIRHGPTSMNRTGAIGTNLSLPQTRSGVPDILVRPGTRRYEVASTPRNIRAFEEERERYVALSADSQPRRV